MNGRNKNSSLCTGLSLGPIPLFLHLTPSYCPDSWLIGFTVGRRKSEKVVRWGNKWEQLTRINQSTNLCRYLTWQMEILCWFKRYCLDYFKIDLENRPQLAPHHLLLDFQPFLHSHSCCSSQPITRIFLQLVEAGLGLPWFACSYLRPDWTPVTVPGNRIAILSLLNLLMEFPLFLFHLCQKSQVFLTYLPLSWSLVFPEYLWIFYIYLHIFYIF